MKKTLWRSIGAVFAGVFTNFIVAVPIDVILHAAGVYPPPGLPMDDVQLTLAFENTSSQWQEVKNISVDFQDRWLSWVQLLLSWQQEYLLGD